MHFQLLENDVLIVIKMKKCMSLKGFVILSRYKVAVVMPNLDELMKDTPTRIFASVWHDWKKTKYYRRHYSELVRLASLYM